MVGRRAGDGNGCSDRNLPIFHRVRRVTCEGNWRGPWSRPGVMMPPSMAHLPGRRGLPYQPPLIPPSVKPSIQFGSHPEYKMVSLKIF